MIDKELTESEEQDLESLLKSMANAVKEVAPSRTSLEAGFAKIMGRLGHIAYQDLLARRGVYVAEALELETTGELEGVLRTYGDAADNERYFLSVTEISDPSILADLVLHSARFFIKARRYEEARQVIREFGSSIEDPAAKQQLVETDNDARIAIQVFSFFDDLKGRLKRRCEKSLRDTVGVLLERFRATSAWLFLLDHNKLISCVTLNADPAPLEIDTEEGIVGHVVRTGRPYRSDNVKKDPYYLPKIEQTRSELAVPIFDTDNELIGVLNFESDMNCWFSFARLWELTASIGVLVPNLLLLKHLREQPLPAMHFLPHTWGVSTILGDFCSHICETLQSEGSRPSCTIWQIDHVTDELWVRANDGFDFEYMFQSLPARQSFTGSVLNKTHGTVVSDHWRNLREFNRTDKAKVMGLSRVISTPIYKPYGEKPVGAVNIYYFFKEGSISKTIVQHIADVVGSILDVHERLQPKVTAAYCAEELARTKSFSIDARCEAMKRVLQDVLKAEACSIFARKKDSAVLECVASTGVEHDGELVKDLRTVKYDLASDQDRSGITGILGTHPGLCIRKNDLPNRHAPLYDRKKRWKLPEIKSRKKYCESFAPSETDHRRFLGISLRAPGEEHALGVIRLVRRAGSRPFVESDESLLERLADVCREIFIEWRKTQALEPFIRDTQQRFLVNVENHDPLVKKSLTKLIRPVLPEYGSNYLLIDDILQNVLTFFSGRGALHVSIREVVNKPDGDELFRLFAYHSVLSNRIPDEVSFPPVSRSEGSLAWTCIENWCALTFDKQRCGHRFKPIHEDSARVVTGVCVPLITWTGGACVKWAFCLDFDNHFVWTPMDVQVLLHTTQKLSAVLSDSVPPTASPLIDLLKEFVAYGVRRARADWGRLELKSAQRTEEVARFGSVPSIPKWSALERAAGGFSTERFRVEVDALRGAYRIPLLFGPFEAGRFTFGNKGMHAKDRDIDMSELIRDVMRRWSGVSVFHSDSNSRWEAHFDPKINQPNLDGIRLWEFEPRWQPPPDVHLSEMPITVSAKDVESS